MSCPQPLSLRPPQDRVYTFTDGRSAFYLGNTHSQSSTAHHGWNVAETHFLYDYRIIAGGQPLERGAAREIVFQPQLLRRSYPCGITETFFLVDGENAFCVELSGSFKSAEFELFTAVNSEKISCGAQRYIFIAGKMLGARVSKTDGGARLTVAVSDDKAAAQAIISRVERNAAALLESRTRRIAHTAGPGAFSCSGEKINDALLWSRISLDSLVMRGGMTGIWAGLPWFNNFWGRDTFISLPGAALVNGDFKTAREILLNFAARRLPDAGSLWHGRIPNIITGGKAYYNTADANGWFILSALKYLRYRGAEGFAREIFPAVSLAIEGPLSKCAGADFLLRHGDAETWMDAAGADGPWTPRGNRAVEIQALWHGALLAGAEIAGRLEEREKSVKWKLLAGEVRKSFAKLFIRPEGGLFDHINADDTPDSQLRPNQIFAAVIGAGCGLPSIMPPELAEKTARIVAEKLTFPYGVLSLSPDDKNFHPWHEHETYRHKDEAYHNGAIWTWLAGPVIEALCAHGQSGLAFGLFAEEARQIMEDGCLGGFSELVEPFARPGQARPRPCGAVNQAWSLAEFQRSFAESFAGWRPFAGENSVELAPSLPPQLDYLTARLPLGEVTFELAVERAGNKVIAALECPECEREVSVSCSNARFSGIISPSSKKLCFEYEAAPPAAEKWQFARPVFNPNWKSLRPY